MTLGAASASRRRTTVVTSAITLPSSVSAGNGSRSPALTFASYTPQLNDVVVMFPSDSAGGVGVSAIPSGWVNPLGGTTRVISDSHQLLAIYHVVTSGEVSAVTTTYTGTNLFDSSAFGNVAGVVLRGVSTVTPIDSTGTAFDSTDTVTPHVLPGLTGTNLSTGSLVLSCVTKDGGGLYASTPAGWTQLTNTNNGNGMWQGYLQAATVANVDVPATNITPSAGDEYAAITIAFTAA